MYTPVNYVDSYSNPADKYSRVFQYEKGSSDMVLRSKTQFFEIDTETSDIEGKDDRQVVAWSLAPKMSTTGCHKKMFAVASDIYTDNSTALKGLCDTLVYFGSLGKEPIAYFHNLDYDGEFLLNWLLACGYEQLSDKKLTLKNADKHDKKFTLLHNHGLFEIRFIYNGCCLVIRDSNKLWASSISDISAELVKINENDIRNGQVPQFPYIRVKEECNYNYDKVRHFGEPVSYDEQLYMLNDALVGVCILQLFSAFGVPGISCSGMAYRIAVKSFQEGVLYPEIVKYLLHNFLSDFLKLSQLERFVRVVVHRDKTIFFTKSWYTLDYNSLTEKSPEYIGSIKTIYREREGRNVQLPVTDIHVLTTLTDASKVIFDGTKSITEFQAMKILKENIVFMSYCNHSQTELAQCILDFINLRELKELKAKTKFHTETSYDYWYQSVFQPLKYTEDEEIRPAYRGGLSAAVEMYSNTMQKNVYSIDINSSYPNQMSNEYMPYGGAIIYEGKMIDYNMIKAEYKCFIMKFRVSYQLSKPNCPMMTERNGLYGCATFINSDTIAQQIERGEYLYMTNIEFELFADTHGVDLNSVRIYKIWAYKAHKGLFKNFVSKLYQIKSNYKGTALYEPVKQMLNSVSGRFAMDRFKFIEYQTTVGTDSRGCLRFHKEEREIKDYSIARGSYLPVSIFITAYGRVQLIKTANKINAAGGTVFYYDTDSLHFTAEKVKIIDSVLNINGFPVAAVSFAGLGDWKLEICKEVKEDGTVVGADNALYVCSKRYLETDNDTGLKNLRCAGVPRKEQSDMSYDDIQVGKVATVNKKRRTQTGLKIVPMEKKMDFSRNIYRTTDGVIVSYNFYFVGDKALNMYGDIVTVTEIIYESREKPKWKLI